VPPALAEACQTRRNPGIDTLRGLSIVLVILHHVAIRIPLRKTALATFVPPRLLHALSYNGYEAVFIFFVISGFLITNNAFERSRSLDAISLRGFYGRRAARILPCLCALLVVLAALHLAGLKDFTIIKSSQSLPRALLSAIGLHLNWYEGRTGWLPGPWDVLWSLSIEEAFYLAFPLVCIGIARTPLFAPMLLVLALSLPLTRAALAGNEIWQEKAYLPGMAAIAAGVLCAIFVRKRPRPHPAVSTFLGAAGVLGIAAVLGAEDVLWRVLGNGTMLVLTSSAASLVAASHWRGPRRLWGTGWLQSFGRLSYECYLTHMFAVLAVVRLHNALGAGLRHAYLWYVPALFLTWVIGTVVARYYSVPAEQAWRARWSGTAGAASASHVDRCRPPLDFPNCRRRDASAREQPQGLGRVL